MSKEVFNIGNFLNISFQIDGVSKIFTALASFLWICSTFYSFEYMKHEGEEIRYFTFSLITLGIIIGLGFAGNLFTFYMFYEFMTLVTFPPSYTFYDKGFHEGRYKIFDIFLYRGASLVLVGIIFVYYYSNSFNFNSSGILDLGKINGKENLLLIIYLLTIIGFGSKAGMFPLHNWLPTAHPIAPAPASGLLSGIITKAGVLGILRTTYFVYGAEFIRGGTWVHNAILVLIILPYLWAL